MKTLFLAFAVVILLGATSGITRAQTQRTVLFRATINPGALLADVRDENGMSINEPTLDLGRFINSVKCRTQDRAISGVLGSNEQRVYVDNPKAAFDGWTLTISPLEGDRATWRGENGHSIDYNDPGTSGCTDADNDGNAGLLSIDPSNADVLSDCLECTTSNITIGSLFEQNFADLPAVTLLQAGESSDDLGSWYMTNVRVKQSVPAGQEGDEYLLEMVLTATAT